MVFRVNLQSHTLTLQEELSTKAPPMMNHKPEELKDNVEWMSAGTWSYRPEGKTGSWEIQRRGWRMKREIVKPVVRAKLPLSLVDQVDPFLGIYIV